MNYKMVLFILGRLFIILAGLLCLPLLVSIISQDGQYMSFVYTIVGLLLLGILLSLKKPINKRIYAREGFVIVASGWIFMAIAGAIPFLLSKEVGGFFDCLFEISSGFSTTGASILTNVEVLSPSIAFWRCFSIWIGGMGVLVFLLAVLPKMDNDMQSMHIFRAESPGPQVSKFSSKLQNTSRVLYLIYVSMTLLQIVLLLFGGLSFFESVTCALSTAGTGGFYIYNASIGYFGSVYVEMVVAVFMILFGINFNVFYFILIGKIVQAVKSEEVRWYLGIITTSILVISIMLSIGNYTTNFGQSLRYGFFQVASIISTTGFTTANFAIWPQLCQMLLVLLMIVGACSSSTGGGIKTARFILLGKSVRASCRQMLSPNTVTTVKFEGKTADEATLTSVRTYFIIYVFLLFGVTLLVSVDGNDGMTNFTAVVSCLNNVGPGLSGVGPTGNYACFGVFSKILLTITMIAGRLELFPIILLANKRTWIN